MGQIQPGSETEAEQAAPLDATTPAGVLPFARRPIALVGMMGVGKTTVGRRLAKRMGRQFFDSDEEIERASGRTVSGYFRDHGEADFRDGERRVIARLLDERDAVVATGGGAFVNPDTRALLQAGALVVWLQADFNTVMARVSKKDTRPLLRVPDPGARVREWIEEREPFYQLAHIHVRVARGPHMRTVGKVERAVDRFIAKAGAPAAGVES